MIYLSVLFTMFSDMRLFTILSSQIDQISCMLSRLDVIHRKSSTAGYSETGHRMVPGFALGLAFQLPLPVPTSRTTLATPLSLGHPVFSD